MKFLLYFSTTVLRGLFITTILYRVTSGTSGVHAGTRYIVIVLNKSLKTVITDIGSNFIFEGLVCFRGGKNEMPPRPSCSKI